jgi:hypothetical protein
MGIELPGLDSLDHLLCSLVDLIFNLLSNQVGDNRRP